MQGASTIKTEGNDMKSHSVRPPMTQRTGEGKKKGRKGHESQRKKKKILERGRKGGIQFLACPSNDNQRIKGLLKIKEKKETSLLALYENKSQWLEERCLCNVNKFNLLVMALAILKIKNSGKLVQERCL